MGRGQGQGLAALLLSQESQTIRVAALGGWSSRGTKQPSIIGRSLVLATSDSGFFGSMDSARDSRREEGILGS